MPSTAQLPSPALPLLSRFCHLANVTEPIPAARLFWYSLGNAGFQITDRIVVAIAVYFYLPPPGRGLENQVAPGVFFGVVTVFGVAMLVGRIFDSLADPLVGHASDRSRSRLGRRRSFMLYGIAPMLGVPVLLFFPPGAPGSASNGVWLTALLSVYFIAFTLYVAPYLALIPEIAWTEEKRVRLARLLAVVGFPIGAGFGTMWTLGYDLGLASGHDPVTSIRLVVIGASVLAAVLCLAPILAVDEARFARTRPSQLSFGKAFGATIRNRPFRLYLLGQLAMVLGVNMVQPALPYIATVALGREEAFAAQLGIATFVCIALSFVPAVRIVSRYGPKRVMLWSMILFGLAVLPLGGLRPDVPGGPHDALNLVLALGASALLGPPVAGLLVVPFVLMSQLIDADAVHTGADRAAMYFGVQGFLTKWVYGVSLWVMTYLLSRFGNSPDEPLGVLLIGPVAGAACLLAALVFRRYPEAELQKRIRSAE